MKISTIQILCFQFVLFLLISCSPSSDENDIPCTYTPTLTTNEVSDITDVSAIFSGKIEVPTCDGTVTSQGFVYARTTLPKIDDIVMEINGENISSKTPNLRQFTKYYMRTFFVNPTGEYYGNQVEFTTAIGDIGISTKIIENITHNSAKSGGVITKDGGATIISRGVCWSTSTNPTINNFKTVDGSGIGTFNSELTGLSEATTYYLRAYSTNEKATTYGDEQSFVTTIFEKTYIGSVELYTQQEVDDFGANNYVKITGTLMLGSDSMPNNSINNVDALSTLTSANAIVLYYNEALTNINGFSNIVTLSNGLVLWRNNAITNLDAFSNLSELGGIRLEYNDLLSNIDGLNSITEMGHISIWHNNSLLNVNGLSNVIKLNNSLYLKNNIALSNLCGISKLILNSGLAGTYNVDGNLYNPTKQDILNGNCTN